MNPIGRSAHWEISEVALSQAIFGAMQVYIPWLAALTAPIHELAMLALAQSIVWPLGIFAQLQLRTLYVVKGQQSLLPLFFRLRLGGCVFLFAAAAVSTVLLRSGILVVNLALALALIKCAELVADILHGEWQRAMKASRAARSQTYRCLIFIAVYTIGMVWSGYLLLSLVAGAAAMACWVVVVDIGAGQVRWNLLSPHGSLDHVGPTLKAGLLLATGLALTSLSMMVGRWAALRAGDTEVLAASALAGTMASLVAMVLGATGQYTLPWAREQFRRGGTAGLRAWASSVNLRLHLAFAGLAAVWACAAFSLYAFGTVLPGQRLGTAVQHTAIVLAGCFLAGGWFSVLSFTDSTELYLTQRYTALLGAAVVQVLAAAAASLLLYPLVGWIAIGIAELVRGLAFLAAMRFSTRGGISTEQFAPSEKPKGALAMRVVLVITKGELGGAQTHVLELCRALRHHCEFLVLIGGHPSSPLGDALRAMSIRVEHLTSLSNTLSPLSLWSSIREVAAHARSWGADLIHVHSAVAAAVGRVGGWMAATPVVYTVHGFAFKPQVRPVRRFCAFAGERLLAPLTRHLICVSGAERELAGRLGLSDDRISVISNGVSDSAMRAEPAASPPAILMVARMAPPKRQDLLLRALEILARRGVQLPPTELAGSGPMLAKWREQAAAAGLSCVTFCGDVTNIDARLAQGQLFVLISDHEGQPISVIEAMRAGLPILASDLPGIRAQVTPGREGLLTPNAPAAIADALEQVLGDSRLRVRLGAGARQRFEREFSAATMAEQVARVYESCARKATVRARG